MSTGWYIDDLHFTGDDDNDGVGNYSDLCPGTPEGESVDSDGCSDCQNNPTGLGCPEADDDGDGVINELDECPETPAGKEVNEKGCHAQFQVQILDVDTTACPTIQTRLIVTDINGELISNFTEANFEVNLSDTLQSPITVQYEGQTTFPVAVSLTLDYSGSMGATAITDMENAAVEFINNLASGDMGEVIKFANGIETAQPFTSNKADLVAAIYAPTSLSPRATEFYDSVYQAITDTSLQGGRKAVIAMTDGRDNASSYDSADVISHALSNGVPVFTIGLGKSVNAESLQSIAEQTGGIYYETPDSSDLASIYQSISIVLKNQYIITFDSSHRDGLSHQLDIIATEGNLFGSDQNTIALCLDSDNDGLRDDIEEGSCTDVNDSDTDDDGILDGTEDENHDGNLDAGETDPCDADSDNDGLGDGNEVNIYFSDPNNPDSDNDSLSDGVEVELLGTDPTLADTDGNGVPDGNEDSDGDGYTNLEEVQCGTDPGDPSSRCSRSLPFLMLLLD
jgi:VWFA-related protein